MISKIQNVKLLDEPKIGIVSNLLFATFTEWQQTRDGIFGVDSFTTNAELIIMYGVINESRYGVVRPCTIALIRGQLCVVPFVDLTKAHWKLK